MAQPIPIEAVIDEFATISEAFEARANALAQTTHNFETSLSSHLFQVNANGTNIGQFVFQDVERAARLREGMERLVREVAALQLTVRNEVRAVDMTLRRGFNVQPAQPAT